MTSGRPLVTEAAVLTTARTVPKAVGVVALLAPLPTIVVALQGGDGYPGALLAASLIAGAGAGYAFDDPAAPTLAALPTSLLARRATRATAVVVILVAAWAIAIVIAGIARPEAANIRIPLPELVATAAISVALASKARTDAPISGGASAALGSLLAVVLIAALAQRLRFLPAFMATANAGRWWWVAGAAFAAAGWWSRDPASQPLRRRH